jgi:hypothetical protein
MLELPTKLLNFTLQFQLVPRLQDGFCLEHRRRIHTRVPVQALVTERVEVRKELIVVALRDGIELVIVALSAAERQTEHRLAERLHAIDVIIRDVLLRDRAAFMRIHVVPLKARGDEQ